MATTATFDSDVAASEAAIAVEQVADSKRAQLADEAAEAQRIAREYAVHLAGGGDPTKHPYPESERTFNRGISRIITGYEGLLVVYELWNEARGSSNPALPFHGGESWRLCERFAQSIGTPIPFAKIKSAHYRSTDPVGAVLMKFEAGGELVVRRTKVDGKVGFLVRERRDGDRPQDSYTRLSIPVEAV